MKNNDRWYQACAEIIAYCVPPEMYDHARDMLEEAADAAHQREKPEVPPLVQLNRERPDFYKG